VKVATAKIRSFPTSKKLSGSNLREFRYYVSQLKKQGVIKGVDARSARPYFKRGGRTLADYVNRNHRRLTPYTGPGGLGIPTKAERLAQGPLEIRDFASGNSLARLFRDIERDDDLAARIDAMKRDDELWAFRIEGTDSHHVYGDIRLLINETFRYGKQIGPYGSQDVFHSREKSEDLIGKLQLIRWNKGPSAWDRQRRKNGKKIERKRKRK
jgi:hypothetical protein